VTKSPAAEKEKFMDEPQIAAVDSADTEDAPENVVEDVLVEEVSIDGMCGVY
jgi:mycofactocin precursor